MYKDFILGNEAVALAAVNMSIDSAYSYPGTPASEILPAIERYSKGKIYTQWSINEKVAMELSAAEAISGRYSLCSMKQVGLNVAADPLFSIAYTGITGSLVIISADDPELNSSQTAQDSRMYAYMSGIPVFDPSNPRDAYELTCKAIDLSKEFEIPVMLRPVEKVCHSRQNIEVSINYNERVHSGFSKSIERWAATPLQRRKLKELLFEKHKLIAEFYYPLKKKDGNNKKLIIASGHPFAIVSDVLNEIVPKDFTLLKLDLVFPLSQSYMTTILNDYDDILILEETYPLIELQFSDRKKVKGRLNNFYNPIKLLSIDRIDSIIHEFLHIDKKNYIKIEKDIKSKNEKPKLCPGCPHRGTFYAIKMAFKEAIYAGDIGCYTLGVNLRALDTCLCMGASISFAEGLSRANDKKLVVATIGDSTFFHTGLPPLINACINNIPVIICILDNITTAMTGFQKVPHETDIELMERIIKAIGVSFIKVLDPYNIKLSIDSLKEAREYLSINKKPAVLVFRRGCILKEKTLFDRYVEITDKCINCGICYKLFDCPAIVYKNKRVSIERNLCINCGLCIQICPEGAIEEI